MNYKIAEIEGIGKSYAGKLEKAGVSTTGGLLKRGATKKGRKELAETTGISEKLILTWCNNADLMRIKGVGKQFAELLEEAGVDTIKELRTRNVANLAAKMKEVNEKKNISRTSPAASMVQRWVDEAKGMEPSISY